MAELEEVGVLLQEGFHEPGLGKPGEVRHGLGLPGAHEVGELGLGALQGPLGLVQVLPGFLGPVLGLEEVQAGGPAAFHPDLRGLEGEFRHLQGLLQDPDLEPRLHDLGVGGDDLIFRLGQGAAEPGLGELQGLAGLELVQGGAQGVLQGAVQVPGLGLDLEPGVHHGGRFLGLLEGLRQGLGEPQGREAKGEGEEGLLHGFTSKSSP